MDQDELAGEYVSWSADWWLKGSSASAMHSEADLQALVDILTDDLVGRGANYVFHLECPCAAICQPTGPCTTRLIGSVLRCPPE
ncbi:hypothetical protein [Kribbella sp. NPDC004536]|uniref:hypothetical protein n=1 Tax=Kribbella sp. NPDC004536 TaxID=3364106 RepID=UPI00367583A3